MLTKTGILLLLQFDARAFYKVNIPCKYPVYVHHHIIYEITGKKDTDILKIITLMIVAIVDTDNIARLIEEQHGRSQNMLTKIYVQLHLSLDTIYNHVTVDTAWVFEHQGLLRGRNIHYAEIITDTYRI
jgi:hypothetical protein